MKCTISILSLFFIIILFIFFLSKIFLFSSIATLFKGILSFLIKLPTDSLLPKRTFLPFTLIFILFLIFMHYKFTVSNIIIINGPNLNLLGEREQSQYGKITFNNLKNICLEHSKKIGIKLDFFQSNVEGEIVTKIQNARKEYDGIIINAAGYTHTSVSIRDAIDIFKKPIIELHISNIYKREEFRQKSLISDIATGGIFGLGDNGYILAIIAMQNMLQK